MKKFFKWLWIILLIFIILEIRSCVTFFKPKRNSTEATAEVTPDFTGEFGNWNPKIEKYYLKFFEPADDALDFRYALDYENISIANLVKTEDVKPLREILGYGDITVEMIAQVCEENEQIPDKYKKIIVEYATTMLQKYPDIDFQILYHNLHDLVVSEKTSQEIQMAAVGSDVLACYLNSKNEILVRDDIVLDKDNDGFIVFTHELTHAARRRAKETQGEKIKAAFNSEYDYGAYVEEGIACNIAYELQGDGLKSNYYPVQSSYLRIILNCLPNYTYADFFNHSVNYLAEQMDAFMGHDKIAYHMLALIDSEAKNRYESYQATKYSDYAELHAYICAMYLKAHLTSDMSYQEALSVYNDFQEDIHHYFDKMKRPFYLSEDWFQKIFDQYLAELNIGI